MEIAASLAVLHFNDGALPILKVLRHMGCLPGMFTESQLQSEDKVRIGKGRKKVSTEEKSRRKQRRRWKKGVEDRQLEAEDDTCGAGNLFRMYLSAHC